MPIQKIMIRQYTLDQPQPLLQIQTSSSNNRFAEFAGVTTAECAAVCCCFPFALVNLLVLAVYGVPSALYRKALRRKRLRKLLKKNGGGDVDGGGGCGGAAELLIYQAIEMHAPSWGSDVDSDVMELENEMWEKFYETGFWRSGSKRESCETTAF